jgi:hypothetical protein
MKYSYKSLVSGFNEEPFRYGKGKVVPVLTEAPRHEDV